MSLFSQTVNPLLLTATAHQSAAALHLHVAVTNTSAQPLYLFNKLARAGGSSVFDIDPNAVNVILGPDHVTVNKAQVPVPDDREVEYHYVPCLSRLLPGEHLAEHLVLPVPLAPSTWYDSSPLRTALVARPLFFELGYAVASAAVERYIKYLDAPDEQTYAAGSFPLEWQEIIRTGPLLEVLVFPAP